MHASPRPPPTTAFHVNDIAIRFIFTKRPRLFYNQLITYQSCRLLEQSPLKSSSLPPRSAQSRYAPFPSPRHAILISFQGAAYGKCIVAEYQNVHKDMCAKEFMKLKNCYLVSVLHHFDRDGEANKSFKGSCRQETMIAQS